MLTQVALDLFKNPKTENEYFKKIWIKTKCTEILFRSPDQKTTIFSLVKVEMKMEIMRIFSFKNQISCYIYKKKTTLHHGYTVNLFF